MIVFLFAKKRYAAVKSCVIETDRGIRLNDLRNDVSD